MTTAFLTATPDARNPRGLFVTFGTGAAFGLLMFSPIAFAEKFRDAVKRWLEQHGQRVQPRVAFLMATALGYFIASVRHRTFDTFTFVAIGLVLVGALFGIVIGVANSDRRRAH
jgi:hypothetical protein